MESSFDYFTNEKLIIFHEGDDPTQLIPDGWEIVDRTEPSEFKGYTNPGQIICKPPKET